MFKYKYKIKIDPIPMYKKSQPANDKNRLERILDKLPSLRELKKKNDIEEEFIKNWQKSIEKKKREYLPEIFHVGKNRFPQNYISGNARDYAYGAFRSQGLGLKFKSGKPAIIPGPLKLTVFQAGRLSLAGIVLFFVSVFLVYFFPQASSRSLDFIDNALNRPVAIIFSAADKQNIDNGHKNKQYHPGKNDFSKFIADNQGRLKTLKLDDLKTIPVSAADIRPETAENRQAEDNARRGCLPCWYGKIRHFISGN